MNTSRAMGRAGKPTAASLSALCPGVLPEAVREHLARLEAPYFAVFSREQVAAHLAALARLSPDHPVEVLFETVPGGPETACTVLAYDYPGEFSLITGLLSSLGFNIVSGDVFTYARAGTDGTAPRRKIIDRFSGLVESELAPEAWQRDARQGLEDVIGRLERPPADKAGGARHRVNERVAARLAALDLRAVPVLYPVRLDVSARGKYTRLRVAAQDTPAFLYALSTALALQGVSIERVRIRTEAGRVEDELDIQDAAGRPLTDPARLDRIRLAVLLTKQFTYFLGHAPDSYAALCRFEQMVEAVLEQPGRGRWLEMLSNPRALEDLARLLGASDYLWEDFIRLQYETLLPILKPHVAGRRFARPASELEADLRARLAAEPRAEEQARILNAFKDRELFLLDLDHMFKPEVDVRAFAEGLTALAELTLRAAAAITERRLRARFGAPRTVAGLEARWALFGLGKFGGVAMGYASDIELLFVYSDSGRTDGPEPLDNAEYFDRFVRDLSELVQAKREGIFHVDVRLRPFGAAGPLACSVESFCRYYGPGGAAHAYERLALVRLRAVGGDAVLGAQVERLRDEFVYAGPPLAIRDLRELRARQLAEKAQPGRINAKFSPGALVDLEYDVQILQVLHGARSERLRTPRIHEALAALSELGVLEPGESERLVAAYYFLRRLINGLRMLRGSARDLFLPPEESEEFAHLARRTGYRRGGDLAPARQLQVDFETHTAVVRAFIERQFGREFLPGPAQGNAADLVLSERLPEPLRDGILRRAGFRDPARAEVNLRRLAGGADSRPAFARLAVLACDFLRSVPDADMALNNWERFVGALPKPAAPHFQRLLEQPRRLDILLGLFSASQFLADTLIRNPEFFDWVTNPAVLHAARPRETMDADLRAVLAGGSPADWLDELRRFRRRELLRIGVRDICLQAPIPEVTGGLSALAEAALGAALERAWSAEGEPAAGPAGFCIVAFGKLGGAELNYSSDIDLLGVCADAPPGASAAEPAGGGIERAARVLKRVAQWLSGHTAEGHAYRVDFRLRPYGRAGPLVHTVSGLADYYAGKAALWELQALLKARPVAGCEAVGRAFLDRVRPLLLAPRPREAVVRSIAALRKSARRAGAADVKNGAGGLRDIEFLVQGLQLIHAPGRPDLLEGNTLKALSGLSRQGLLPEAAARQLEADYVFLRRVEHGLQLLEDLQVHAVPAEPAAREALARRVLGPGASLARFDADLEACRSRVREAYARRLLEAGASD